MVEPRHPIVTEDLQRICERVPLGEFLPGRTVLVTGASGLVAGYLVEAILYHNELSTTAPATVLAVVRNPDYARRRFAAYSGRGDLRLIQGDVCQPLQGLEHESLDYIIHAAGLASPRLFGSDPVGTYAPNVLGTHLLLQLARAHRVSGFLFLSSGAVYGTLDSPRPIDESTYGAVDPLRLNSCYAESKRMGETMCSAWLRQFQVSTVIARLGHTYGPLMRREDGRVCADFVFSVVDRRDIVLNSDGSAQRLFCYLSDATVALLLLLARGARGEAYTVANASQSTRIRDLAHLVAGLFPDRGVRVQLAGEPPPGYHPNTDPPQRFDTSKLERLGWTPEIGIAAGFRRTIESYL